MHETTEPSKPGVSYIVPAYNEEDGIADTLERLKTVLGGGVLPFEIIVVDDGSTDETAQRVDAIEDINVVTHPINTGYGSAIKTGILCAQYEWIGIVDADGTYEIEKLPLLIEKMQNGFDMAVAVRKNVLETDGWFKRLARLALLKFISVWVSGTIEDPNSGFRLFTKEFALTFFPFLCDTFSFTTSSTIFATGEGYFVSYVPMDYKKRFGKSKVRHMRDSFRMMQLIFQGITFFNPLKFFIILILVLLFGVFAPGAALGLFGLTSIAWLFVLAGTASCFLFGLGVLGDIIRISTTTRVTKDRTNAGKRTSLKA